MERDREQTRQRILDALDELLSQEGPAAIGVNAVARRAGVDKVLIYRYFGGLDGLLAEYGRGRSFWPHPEDLVDPAVWRRNADAVVELSVAVLQGHLRELRKRPVTQEVLRWELQERNALTEALARAREEEGMETLERLPFDPEVWPQLDLAAMGALLHAGLTYLVLRSKTADEYLGVNLDSEEGWQRLEAAVETLVRGAFQLSRKDTDDGGSPREKRRGARADVGEKQPGGARADAGETALKMNEHEERSEGCRRTARP